MIKEAKNIDFITTGKQPSDQDFVRISEWIQKKKQEKPLDKNGLKISRKKLSRVRETE